MEPRDRDQLGIENDSSKAVEPQETDHPPHPTQGYSSNVEMYPNAVVALATVTFPFYHGPHRLISDLTMAALDTLAATCAQRQTLRRHSWVQAR